MSQKDFTGYGGRKRKSILRPPKEKPLIKLTFHKKDKPVGFKIKVDRLRSAIQALIDDKTQRAIGWADYRQKGRREFLYWYGWKWVKGHIKTLRKMKQELLKEGIYEKALISIREQGWPKPTGFWAEMLRKRSNQ
jgi:hypothetical protein